MRNPYQIVKDIGNINYCGSFGVITDIQVFGNGTILAIQMDCDPN